MVDREKNGVFDIQVIEPGEANVVIEVPGLISGPLVTVVSTIGSTKGVLKPEIELGPAEQLVFKKPAKIGRLPGGFAKHGFVGGGEVIVVTVKDAARGRLLVDLVERLDEQVSREGMAADRIVEALTPEPATSLRPAQVEQLARSAEVFTGIEREFGFYTGPQVGELAGSTAGNRSATATRWRGQGRIFAISRAGAFYYPRFQFGPDNQPKDVVARVIAAFGSAGDSGWVLGSWFVAVNAYLADATAGGRRPVDVMDCDADKVVVAADAAVDGGP